MHKLEAKKRADGSLGLMGHVIADYPTPAAVRAMIGVMAEVGAEVIEIQLPFSEPMADGPVFLAANHAALAQGVRVADGFALMREMSAKYPQVSFVFMSYLNVIFKHGYDRFATDAAAAGARGMIVPDLPFEYAQTLDAACARLSLTNVPLIPPNCEGERLAKLCARADRLIYAVARTGVTGAKTSFGGELDGMLARIRPLSQAPIAVGFGVKGPAELAALKGKADLAIVGTASLETFQKAGQAGFQTFWQGLASAARG